MIKVTLIEDGQLRAEIKEMVAGHLRGIVREEIQKQISAIVSDEIRKKCSGTAIQHHLEKNVRDIVSGYWIQSSIKKESEAYLKEKVPEAAAKALEHIDFDQVIEDIIRKQIRIVVPQRSN